MAVEGLEYLKRELEKIADEATTDCYNEYEQIAGWCAYLEDKIFSLQMQSRSKGGFIDWL